MKDIRPKTIFGKQSDDGVIVLPKIRHRSKLVQIGLWIVAFLLIGLLVLLSIRLLSKNRFYPGSKLYGVNISGLDKDSATAKIQAEVDRFVQTPIVISHDTTTWRVKPTEIKLSFDVKGDVAKFYEQSRAGGIFDQLGGELAVVTGQYQAPVATTSLDQNALADSLNEPIERLNTPVSNASLVNDHGNISLSGGNIGQRLDLGGMNFALQNQFDNLSSAPIGLPVLGIEPAINSAVLADHQAELADLVNNPVTLAVDNITWTVTADHLLSWLSLPTTNVAPVRNTLEQVPNDYYNLAQNKIDFTYDKSAITTFVKDIAKKVDLTPTNATLAMIDDKVAITKDGSNGKTLDVASNVDKLVSVIKNPTSQSHKIDLKVATTQPDIRRDTLDSLGIKEVIAENTTTFPGSSNARLTNIRVGASQFNNTTIKPGEIFSFGARMGEIGPEQGYLPSLVIGEGKVDNQYGGGMCQVSTTAFRTALLAGLPIIERINHSYQVSYYTAPYGVPGVDAAIFYPGTDLKFKNDTGSYIFIQTEMKGSTLTFRFFGTKTKVGVIRGPQFISGSLDPNVPSRTVFWRDVVVDDKVVKTDTFNTYYRSELDFPTVR